MAMLTYSDFKTWPSDVCPPTTFAKFLVFKLLKLCSHYAKMHTYPPALSVIFNARKKVLFILLFVLATRRAAESSPGSQEEGPAKIPQPDSDRCVCDCVCQLAGVVDCLGSC